jgi:hypothetical protein
MAGTGVFPVSNIAFTVNTQGRTTPGTQVVVKDMETFSITLDNGVEEWTPMDTDGWVRRLMTAKSMTVSLNGKRHYGDPGNDYIAGLAYKNGQDCNSQMEIIFPDGGTLAFDCVINVTEGGGDSTAVEALSFEAMSDGKPTYTEG